MRRRYWVAAILSACGGIAVVAGFALASGGGQQTSPASPAGDGLWEQASAWQEAARREHPNWRDQPEPRQPNRPKWRTVEKPRGGLIDVSKPFPSAFYLLEQYAWHGWRDGWLTMVYSGVMTEDRPQGIVIVHESPYPLRYRWDADRSGWDDKIRVRLYETPIRSGSVRIVRARGDLLTLVSASGRRMTFDVSERKFRVL